MKAIEQTTQFRKDFRRMVKQGRDALELFEVIDKLANGEALDEKYRDHALSGDWEGFRECHVRPDWLRIGC